MPAGQNLIKDFLKLKELEVSNFFSSEVALETFVLFQYFLSFLNEQIPFLFYTALLQTTKTWAYLCTSESKF